MTDQFIDYQSQLLSNLSAQLSFFYHCLNLPYELERFPFPKEKRKLPSVFSFKEVTLIINNAGNLKRKAMLMLIVFKIINIIRVKCNFFAKKKCKKY